MPPTTQYQNALHLVVYAGHLRKFLWRRHPDEPVLVACRIWQVNEASKLLCGELSSLGDETNVISVSLESGATGQLGSITGLARIFEASRDGRALYIVKACQVTQTGAVVDLVRWEIATGRDM